MSTPKALRIIRILVEGVDPYTGELLPPESPYQQADTVRALYQAIKALERQKALPPGHTSSPESAGQPWSYEEERRLLTGYESGMSVKDLAKQHSRTEGAIRSRLAKLGRLPAR